MFGSFLYFDPGTGALIVQFLVALGASILLFYKKVKLFFIGLFSRKKQNQPDEFGEIDLESTKESNLKK